MLERRKSGSFTAIFLFISIILILLYIIYSPYITQEHLEEEEEEKYPVLESLVMLFGFITVCIAFWVAYSSKKKFKKSLVYLAISMIFFTFTRLFNFLEVMDIKEVHTSFHAGGHVAYYVGIGLFVYGLFLFNRLIQDPHKKEQLFKKRDAVIFILSGMLLVLGIIFFFTADNFFKGTLFGDQNGFIHFLAFIAGTYAILQLLEYQSSIKKYLAGTFTLFFFALFFGYILHLWELLAESWHILHFSEVIIEGVEVTLLILSMFLFSVAFLVFHKKEHNPSKHPAKNHKKLSQTRVKKKRSSR